MDRQGQILVTGAGGLVGGAVGRHLAASGRAVIGTDLAAPPDTPFPIHPADLRDTHRLLALLRGGCSAIIHCGGISGPMLARDNPMLVAEANVTATVSILELARLLGVPRVVACSSVAAYGPTPAGLDPVDESAPLRASDLYSASKAAADLLVGAFAAQYGVDAVAMRIGWVYGPRRRTDGILHPMLRAGLGGPPADLAAGHDQHVQFIHVDDVAAGLIAAADAPRLPQRAYNLTGPDRMPLPAIAEQVRRLLPKAEIRIGPGLLEGEPVQAQFSAAAAARDLGWRPRIDFATGLRGYAAWLDDHPY